MKPSPSELSHIPIFKALSDAQFRKLVGEAQLVSLPRNHYLFHQDDVSTHFYYLVSGQIKISRGTPQGNEKILSIIHPRQLFAEAAMFIGNSQYPASASTLEACEVVGFSSQTFIQLLHESTDLALAMIVDILALPKGRGFLSTAFHARKGEF